MAEQLPELQFAAEAARRAGDLLLSHFRKPYPVVFKGDRNHPVTPADLAADSLLRQCVAGRYPEDGWLSEESADAPQRLSLPRVWIVDPLDGTREFVRGLPEFAVSLALVEEGRARVAAVYNPSRQDLFVAESGAGTFRNGSRVRASGCRNLGEARILASRSEHSAGLFGAMEAWGNVRILGSIAYKLALVAAGEGDMTLSFRPKNEWDVCAGGLLVQEAGGEFTDLSGREITYNRINTRIQGVLAANSKLHEQALERFGVR